jgi:hypothetical protein
MASRVARARCALVLKRDIPTIAPRASERQKGAKSPEKAGTKYRPPESSTWAASLSMSAAPEMIPSWSRSHCTAEPVTAMEPSSA